MSSDQMGRSDYLDLGNWNAECGMCGRKRKASEMKQLPPGVPGAGLYVCNEHDYKRNPQDYVRGMPDNMTPPWVQHTPDLFITFCTPNANTAIADFAYADCAIADYISPSFDPNGD